MSVRKPPEPGTIPDLDLGIPGPAEPLLGFEPDEPTAINDDDEEEDDGSSDQAAS